MKLLRSLHLKHISASDNLGRIKNLNLISSPGMNNSGGSFPAALLLECQLNSQWRLDG